MLYTDEKIGDTFADVGFAEYGAMAYGLAVNDAQKMRDEYEAAMAAEIKQLKSIVAEQANALRSTAVAAMWQPIEVATIANHQTIKCACLDDCGDELILWKSDLIQVVNKVENRTADMFLPDDVRLCRKGS